jgi:hypothetical protein
LSDFALTGCLTRAGAAQQKQHLKKSDYLSRAREANGAPGESDNDRRRAALDTPRRWLYLPAGQLHLDEYKETET